MTTGVVLATVFGIVFGLGADRLSSRWPRHADGAVRGLDWRTVVVMLGSAASFAALAAAWTEPTDLVVLGIYVAALIVLLATDLDQKLLPDLITLPLIVYAASVTLLGLNPVLDGKTHLLLADGDLAALLGAVLAPVILAISDRVFHGALGRGDLKLAVSLGLLFGVTQLFVGFLIASVAFAAVVLLLLLARRLDLKTAVPFGPALIGAGVLAAVIPA
jgi:leader peptidase (prepilin peptidase)/N-methyltransferase